MKIREPKIISNCLKRLSVLALFMFCVTGLASESQSQIIEQFTDQKVEVSTPQKEPEATNSSEASEPPQRKASPNLTKAIEPEGANDSEGANDTEGANESPRLNARQLARKTAIERCLSIYYTRQVDAGELRPWSLMHGLLAYGRDSRVVARNQSVSAVEYLCNNGVGDDRKLMSLDGQKKIRMHVGPGYQGHSGQLLAMLAQSNVPINQAVNVDGQGFSLEDVVEYEKLSCRDQTELTFKLIALSHYLPPDATWKNDVGQNWSISRMIDQEIKQPIIGAACGGTHRLMGLSYSIKMRTDSGSPIDGQWARAASVVKQHQDTAFAYQNVNGSFSTAFFQMKSSQGDTIDHLLATGHQLEWLVFSLPKEQLRDPRIELAIDYVVGQMLRMPNYNVDVGPRGHAIRALKLYEAKMFGASAHDQLMPSGVQRITEAVLKPVRPSVVARPVRTNSVQKPRRRFGRR